MGLGWGVSPPMEFCWHGVFCSGNFTRGPGGKDSTGLYYTLCESLGFLIMESWIVVEFLGPFVPVPPS